MMTRRTLYRLALIATALVPVAVAGPSLAADVPAITGTPPQSEPREPSDVPGEQAMVARIWMPGIDEGFVPQGLTVVGNDILVAAYRTARPESDAEICRVFRLNSETGAQTGAFALPTSCGHPGGLAHDRQGTLFIADTSILYIIDLDRALADGNADRAVQKAISFGGGLRGSFTTYRDGSVWIGVYHRREPRRIYRFPVATLMAKKPSDLLTEADAAENIPVSARTQGAAFDAKGALWITQSGRGSGTLQMLDPRGGSVKLTCDMPPGIEDISFDAAGRLWAVSEAGAGRHQSWPTYYPIIFALDPARLKSC